MKKIFLNLVIVGLILSLGSCKKDVSEPAPVQAKATKDLKVPDNFTWTTSRPVSVNLQFVYNSQIVANAPFQIYAGTQSSGKMIFNGTANDQGQYKSLIKVADYYSTIQVVCGNDVQLINLTDTTIYHPKHPQTSEKSSKANAVISLSTKSFIKSKAESHTFYPAENLYGSIAFEDNWPNLGDFDFNDLVLDYNVDVTTNESGYVTKIVYKFIPRGCGAGFHNGFGIQFDWGVNYSDIASVTGSINNKFPVNVQGLEEGQTNGPSFIVFDDAWRVAKQSNTDPTKPYVENPTVTITVLFTTPKNIWNFGFPLSNPFMIVNGDRSREIHCSYNWPTSKATYAWAQTADDNTPYFYFDDAPNTKMVAMDPSYKSKTGLTWAICLEEKFIYPIEKADIINAHLQFGNWVTTWDPWDWYTNQPGYRNNNYLYLVGGIN